MPNPDTGGKVSPTVAHYSTWPGHPFTGGPIIEVGVSYTVIPASSVDDALRAKLQADYPKCAIVDVVGRSVR